MREALKSSNRQMGAYKGWNTRLKEKNSELKAEVERLRKAEQRTRDRMDMMASQFKKFDQFLEQAKADSAAFEEISRQVDALREMKLRIDEDGINNGYHSTNAIIDLMKGIDSFLEAMDDLDDHVYDRKDDASEEGK